MYSDLLYDRLKRVSYRESFICNAIAGLIVNAGYAAEYSEAQSFEAGYQVIPASRGIRSDFLPGLLVSLVHDDTAESIGKGFG